MTAAEVRARYLKSEKLALTILAKVKELGFGPAEAINFAQVATPAEWAAVAAEATEAYGSKVHPPHSQETIDEVLRMLEQELSDPFVGLGTAAVGGLDHGHGSYSSFKEAKDAAYDAWRVATEPPPVEGDHPMISCESCNLRPATTTFTRKGDERVVGPEEIQVCERCATEEDLCEICHRTFKLANLFTHADGFSCLSLRCFNAMSRREAREAEDLVHGQESIYRGMV